MNIEDELKKLFDKIEPVYERIDPLKREEFITRLKELFDSKVNAMHTITLEIEHGEGIAATYGLERPKPDPDESIARRIG